MDITKFVGNLQHKKRNTEGIHRIYFDLTQYPVTEEIHNDNEIANDKSAKIKVKFKFKSATYVNISKGLREANGRCCFNINQNGSQKFTYEKMV